MKLEVRPLANFLLSWCQMDGVLVAYLNFLELRIRLYGRGRLFGVPFEDRREVFFLALSEPK